MVAAGAGGYEKTGESRLFDDCLLAFRSFTLVGFCRLGKSEMLLAVELCWINEFGVEIGLIKYQVG